MSAILIALLLGVGTGSVQMAELYVSKLRALRTADLAARAQYKATVSGTTTGSATAVADKVAATNGADTGRAQVTQPGAKTCYTFPCGVTHCI